MSSCWLRPWHDQHSYCEDKKCIVNTWHSRRVTKRASKENNLHSTLGGIWNVVESEVVIELSPHDVVSPGPSAGVSHGGQSQRNQGSKSKMHLIWFPG